MRTTAYDVTSNTNDGTLATGNSAPTWTGLGRFGSALSFDGTNDYLSVADNDLLDFGTGPFTIGGWVKHDTISASSDYIINKTEYVLSAGDGADGAITVSSDKNINTDTLIGGRSCADGGDAVNYSVTALESAGETSVTLSTTPSAGCFAVGDEFLIINLRGTNGDFDDVGEYETHVISSISTATLSFTDSTLTNTYDEL